MLQAFVSRSIVAPQGLVDGILAVESGVIQGLGPEYEAPAGAGVIDLGQCAILPGLVDTHVHLNEPGRTEWEGFSTGTRAAAAGGFTTIVDMPLNCLPETTNTQALKLKRAAAEQKCRVDWMAWGGVVAENAQELEPLAQAGVPGWKCFLIYPGCEGFTSVNRKELERALPTVARLGLPLLVHAELAGPIEEATVRLAGEDWRRYATYLRSRPEQAEMDAIAMLLDLCRRYRFRLHIVHLSAASALPMLRAAKAEGLPVTVETCPHYLCFAAEQIADGATLLKCAPPIRGEANQEALWNGLREGVIDLVATDHSPCPPIMKGLEAGRFDLAWGGIASLSVALPAMWTEARPRGFSLADLARWMSAAPAQLAGITCRAGRLETGRPANFVVFDPEARWVVQAEDLPTRHSLSPYLGREMVGSVEATYLRGECVWRRRGRIFPGGEHGRELAVC